MPFPPISLAPHPASVGPLTALAATRAAVGVDAALAFAVELGEIAVAPGMGETADLWEALATIAARDLGTARAVEPHLDALAILSQAGQTRPEGTWGVFAAEGGTAPVIASLGDGGWLLRGTKPWCSLADRLDHALVTAQLDRDERGLFAVDLRGAGVRVEDGAWHARGLVEIPSGPVTLTNVPANRVGEPGWYLTRPGFAWGGMGVAACWYGGAVGIARSVFERAGASPDPLLAMQLGAIDEQLQSARRALAEAAQLIDSHADDAGSSVLAKRVRATVARVCEDVLLRAGHALGPGPLALDGEHAKRVADLELYIRQHHAEKDQASLGSALTRQENPPW